MKKRSVLNFILAVVFVFTTVFAATGSAFAATKTDLSGYAGVYTLKQGTTTVAKVTVKYEKNVLSVSTNSKTWYNLVLKAKTTSTYTMPKLPGITIEFQKGNIMKYSQNGLFSIVLTGKKTANAPATPAKPAAADYSKYVGEYMCYNFNGTDIDPALLGLKSMKVTYENGKLYEQYGTDAKFELATKDGGKTFHFTQNGQISQKYLEFVSGGMIYHESNGDIYKCKKK